MRGNRIGLHRNGRFSVDETVARAMIMEFRDGQPSGVTVPHRGGGDQHDEQP
jgi:hypothetical protein